MFRNVKNICDASAYTSKRSSGESRIKKLKKEISEDKEKKILIEEKGQDASTIKTKEADKSDNDSGKMMEGEVPNDVLEKDSILNVDPGMQVIHLNCCLVHGDFPVCIVMHYTLIFDILLYNSTIRNFVLS